MIFQAICGEATAGVLPHVKVDESESAETALFQAGSNWRHLAKLQQRRFDADIA